MLFAKPIPAIHVEIPERRPSAVEMLMWPQSVVRDNRTWWYSLRLQACVCLFFGSLLPPVFYFFGDLRALIRDESAVNSIVASLIAASGGLIMARKVNGYPGTKQLGSVIPGFASSFGLVSLAILATRVNYSASILLLNFVMTLSVYMLFLIIASRSTPITFYAVPGGSVGRLSDFGIVSVPLVEPVLPEPRGAMIVADLHFDMPAAWERMLARAALSGIPVFHYKQVCEAVAGKVQVEHLSENSLGSLLPNMSYSRVKRTLDVLLALAALPFLAIPFGIVALAIKLDSPGPIFFRQSRLGYRGKIFRMTKFRTMYSTKDDNGGDEEQRALAMTSADDARITKVGGFLRRIRFDELPQVFNILVGDMSWIGPRPEAIPLSEWYEEEIPFYSYRHIIRPGLTGWAQVNQGHVTGLEEIDSKVQFDFYYIKNFSFWLDFLIVFRTISVIASGYGAK